MTATDSLAVALHLADQQRWCPIPLMPLEKAAALKDSLEKAATDPNIIRRQWDRAAYRIGQDTDHPDRRQLPPGIGIVLGPSRLAVVDADTPGQVAAWEALCRKHGFDPGPRTVASPGVIAADGVAKHKDGGHWYYRLPPGLDAGMLATQRFDLKIGMPGAVEKASLMSGSCYVVIPPTRRVEGPYVHTRGAKIPDLPPFLADVLTTEMNARKAQQERARRMAESGERDQRLWDWFDATPWEDILPGGYREVGAESDGCVRWLRPGGSSSHSATTHVPGCSHLPDGDPSQPPPVTFFTSELPGYVADALATVSSGRTVSKLKLLAFRDFGGDMRAARRTFGLIGRVASPPSQRRNEEQQRDRQCSSPRSPRPAGRVRIPMIVPLPGADPAPAAAAPPAPAPVATPAPEPEPEGAPAPTPAAPQPIPNTPGEARPTGESVIVGSTTPLPVYTWYSEGLIHMEWDPDADPEVTDGIAAAAKRGWSVVPGRRVFPPTRAAFAAHMGRLACQLWPTVPRCHFVWQRGSLDAELCAELGLPDAPDVLTQDWQRSDCSIRSARRAESWATAERARRAAQAASAQHGTTNAA